MENSIVRKIARIHHDRATDTRHNVNLKYWLPNASKSFHNLNSQVSATKSKLDAERPLDSKTSRKTKGMGRTTISYRGFFVRPQDPDNFVGSTKWITDGLRACRIIEGDNIWQIKLIHDQEKVSKFDDEKLEITITW